jgi:sugar/nucleoside kinase (ribokinase family)
MGILNLDKNRKTIVGVGSALVDLLAFEPDAFIESLGVEKGGMQLVDSGGIDALISKTATPPVIVPGGSACNTAIGVGRLGGETRFVGKLGRDHFGELFVSGLKDSRVEPVLFVSGHPTGRVLSVVTPDAQRTMFTFLGAAAQMRPDEVTPDCFRDAAVVHVEGYLVFNRELMRATLASAKAAGALVSLDMASFNLVNENKGFLKEIIDGGVDILIANQDEAKAYTGHEDAELALQALSKGVAIVALKLGPGGSLIARGGRKMVVAAMGTGSAVDTTGAGDLWASGFLYGLVNGFSLEKSGALASTCGYEVCQVVGAGIPADGWKRIRKLLSFL